MQRESLERLIQRADAGAPRHGDAATDMAARLILLAHRRQVLAMWRNAAAAAVLVIGGGMLLLNRPQLGPQRENGTAGQTSAEGERDAEFARMRTAADALAIEADSRLHVARAILRERERELRIANLRSATAQRSEQRERARQQVDQAAFIMVLNADRMYHELNLPVEAIEAYRRALRLFPHSAAADMARERLAEIPDLQGV